MIKLIAAVKHMRYCQNEYFRTKNYQALVNAKAAEKKVDQLLKHYDDVQVRQLKLKME
jgi:hypothetical protein